jgi:hypothetical protein
MRAMKNFLSFCPLVLLARCTLGFSPTAVQPRQRQQQRPSSCCCSTTTRSLTRLCLSSEIKGKGDPLREATGIRPSLHPITINAIADALKARAKQQPGMVFSVSETVKPIDVALTAGKIASNVIAKRQQSSANEEDGMKLTPKEEQTIAGRILGVLMRLDDLEEALFDKVSQVAWIQKYNEWASFGTLSTNNMEGVEERIRDDPLFAMSRAECLLAIFMQTVEIPHLQKADESESVPDSSKLDFIDADRLEVLCL